MGAYCRTILMAWVILILLAGCGGPRPELALTATQVLPQATAAPPTETVSPTDALILPTVTSAPPTATSAPLTVTPELASDESALTITYTCNDGFIISAGEKKVLIDALFRDPSIPCYTDPEVVSAMTKAGPPFDGVDLILISHGHPDHFEPQVVGTYLHNNPKAMLVTLESVVDELQKQFSGFDQVQDRVRGFQLAEKESVQMTIQGIDLEMISAPADVPNLGFLIQIGGLTLFHTGDSDSDRETVDLFQSYHLPDKRIDLAFVPWWYLGDEWYHPLVEEGIQAKDYVPMHFVGDDAARMFKVVPTYYPQAILFRSKMQTRVYSPPTATGVPAATPMPPTATPVSPAATPQPAVTATVPPLSSGGGVIAFVSDRSGIAEVYAMNADGSDQRQLTNKAYARFPAWSPDGLQIAFQGNPPGQWDIYVIDADGTNLRQLTDDPAADQYPAWRPLDSATVVLSPTLVTLLSRAIQIPVRAINLTSTRSLLATHTVCAAGCDFTTIQAAVSHG